MLRNTTDVDSGEEFVLGAPDEAMQAEWLLTLVEDLERHADGTRQPFTALIADCEGFLGTFLDENPRLLDGLELVVYEADAPDVCDYAGIRRLLRAHAFECVVAGEQNVWRRARATA